MVDGRGVVARDFQQAHLLPLSDIRPTQIGAFTVRDCQKPLVGCVVGLLLNALLQDADALGRVPHLHEHHRIRCAVHRHGCIDLVGSLITAKSFTPLFGGFEDRTELEVIARDVRAKIDGAPVSVDRLFSLAVA